MGPLPSRPAALFLALSLLAGAPAPAPAQGGGTPGEEVACDRGYAVEALPAGEETLVRYRPLSPGRPPFEFRIRGHAVRIYPGEGGTTCLALHPRSAPSLPPEGELRAGTKVTQYGGPFQGTVVVIEQERVIEIGGERIRVTSPFVIITPRSAQPK